MKKKRKSRRSSTRSTRSGSKKYDILYLLERVSGKSTRSSLLMLMEVKIGVTNQTAERRKDAVDLAVPGKVVVIRSLRIPGRAQIWERKLLRKYFDKRFEPSEAGSGAGRTEWRRITWLDYIVLLGDFKAIQIRTWPIRNSGTFWIIIIIILLTFIIFYYAKFKTY